MLNQGKGRAQYGAPLKNTSHLPPRSPLFPSNLGHLDPFRGSHVGNLRPSNRGPACEKSESEPEGIPPTEPSWLNELLDSPKLSQRRFSHRRSASDTVAFLESPVNVVKIDGIAEEQEFVSSSEDPPVRLRGSLDFDQLDEEPIVNLFSHLDLLENPSAKPVNLSFQSPQAVIPKPRGSICISDSSDTPLVLASNYHIMPSASRDEMKPSRGIHMNGGHGLEVAGSTRNSTTFSHANHIPAFDDVEVDEEQQQTKRLTNKQSAQRSRVRKLQYIAELERRVNVLQTEVATLGSQVAYLDHQRLILSADNKALKQRLSAVLNERQFKDAHIEALRKERHRLRLLLYQQRGQLVLHPKAAAISKPFTWVQQDREASPAVTDTFVRLVKASSLPANWTGTVTSSVKNSMPSGCSLAGNSNTLEAAIIPPDFVVQNP